MADRTFDQFFDQLQDYCEAHSSTQSELLYRLERETYLKTLAPQMMSGQLQGRLLSLLSKLLRPNCILEIGTFTGYATLCLAEGLSANGQLHTIEGNEELSYISQKYFDESAFASRIHPHIGDAKTIIPQLDLTFDLVFIDAAKLHYALFFDLVIDKVRPGGILLADNVLWSGKVVRNATDKDTRTI
ncbi:MAG: class I SAM-dependent methyltransferase, partial [Bacteroidota bacterium]